MSSLCSSKSHIDIKRCFISQCNFRNFTKAVVTEDKYPSSIDETLNKNGHRKQRMHGLWVGGDTLLQR